MTLFFHRWASHNWGDGAMSMAFVKGVNLEQWQIRAVERA